MKKKLDHKMFEELVGRPVGEMTAQRIDNLNLFFSNVTTKERDVALRIIFDALLRRRQPSAGDARLGDWEKGWGENLEKIRSGDASVEDCLVPAYFSKYPFLRIGREIVRPETPGMESSTLGILLDYLFEEYAGSFDTIYEFGCGTGKNLLRARCFNHNAELVGLDWSRSSQRIIEEVRESGFESHIFGRNFDYFNPDYEFDLVQNSLVLTVASLEQVGTNWMEIFRYWQSKRPKLLIHVEPVAELLDYENLLDFLSIEYFKMRNYLDGYLTFLRSQENLGKIQIIDSFRSNIGSLFIDGYSVIVWKFGD